MRDNVNFEIFELSPPNEAVYSTNGRLRRHFPEEVVEMQCESLRDGNVRNAIANTLGTMSRESVDEMQPRARKAKTEHIEERDTVRSFMVKNLFSAVIQALGGARSQCDGIWKHTREEVIWSHGSKLPWRRSPVWLLLKVTLQSTLSPLTNEGARPSLLYKTFMVFLLSKVLEQCLQADVDCDQLDMMSMKIARRLIKLDLREAEGWMRYPHKVVERTKQTLNERWISIMQAHQRTLSMQPYKTDDIERDTSIQIPQLNRYLETIPQRQAIPTSAFHPPIPDIRAYEPNQLPDSIEFDLDGVYGMYNLAGLEVWVSNHLSHWVSIHATDTGTCSRLRNLLCVYKKAATYIYQGRPEGMSVMVLTTLELWVACDKSAIAWNSLVSEYEPEIPSEPLMSLNFRSAQHMKRLHDVECYLRSRSQRASSRRSIVFDFGHSGDFGVRFFSQSSRHQNLLAEITENAKRARVAKREEFRQLQGLYHQYKREASTLSCSYISRTDKWGDTITEHNSSGCRKCSLSREADDMRISAHEWPVPEDPRQAQAIVFELHLPPDFAAWRDSTLFVLQDVMGLAGSGCRPEYSCSLQSYSELSRYFLSCKSRISMLSEVKPEAVTHRRDKKIGLISEEEVCLKTGPRWSLFDEQEYCFLERSERSEHISTKCTFIVPENSSYSQPFITRTWQQPDGIAPNRAIADQHKCPSTSSIEEFKALCSLPLGRETQWHSVLLNLAMPFLDINKLETFLLIWQTVEQSGLCASTWRRVTHRRTEDTRFVNACLANLAERLDNIKESWKSRHALAVLTLIGCRLLSTCPGQNAAACLTFLAACRDASLRWLRTLRHRAFGSQDKTQRLDYSRRAYEAALVCLSSFAVDDEHVNGLAEDSEASRAYLESLMTKQETDFCANHDENPLQLHLSLRCQWIIRRFHRPIQDAISKRDSGGLDLAIETNWHGFRRQSECIWQITSICWLHGRAIGTSNSSSYLDVHVNLITGELLVNGLPRQRLPQRYETHSTYKLLFGHVAFESMPSGESGMRFTASKTFKGYQLHFWLDEASDDLIVRAQKDGTTWELLPQRILEGIIPSNFQCDYVYWYDIRTSAVSFLPTKDAWDKQNVHWLLFNSKSEWNLHHVNGSRAIFPATPTAQQLGVVFAPLADVLGLNIVSGGKSGSIEVSIPRFQLGFFLKVGSDKICSSQYRGMYIDPDQDIGTLTGLHTKLVLRGFDEVNTPRLVLIPNGKPVMSQNITGTIPKTSLDVSDEGGRIQRYDLDHHVRRLKGNGSLESYLFLAELHAITSGVVPDAYTGHTGTEEALGLLDSAAVRSLEFDLKAGYILRRIAALAPSRAFYPKGMRLMQVVDWAPVLRSSAQSDLFVTLSQKLADGAKLRKVFRQVPISINQITDTDWNLTKRALRRSFFHDRADGLDSDVVLDVEHLAESDPKLNLHERTKRAYLFGSAMRTGPGILSGISYHGSPATLYDFLSASDETDDALVTIGESYFGYSNMHMRSPISVLPPVWRKLHLYLRGKDSGMIPHLTAWMATLAFAPEAVTFYLQILLAFSKAPGMVQIQVPEERSYQLVEGRSFKAGQIRDALRNSKIKFEESAEARLAKQSCESNKQVSHRRRQAFDSKVAQEASRVEMLLQQQWPSHSTSFDGIDLPYFRRVSAMQTIDALFGIWSKNLEFFEYLNAICHVLNSAVKSVIDDPLPMLVRSTYKPLSKRSIVHLVDILNRLPAPALHTVDLPQLEANFIGTEDENNEEALRIFSEALRATASSSYERSYVDMLDGSINCLRQSRRPSGVVPSQSLTYQIQHTRKLAETNNNYIALRIRQVLSLRKEESLCSWSIAAQTHYWPRPTTRNLLLLLNRDHWASIPEEWKGVLAQLAISISQVQTSERLSKALHQSPQVLLRELSGAAPRSWDPCQFPDSLLLEVENNLRIRPVQVDIASAMTKTPDGKNATMQLNMGEGKSTVIVPKIAVWLADGSRLVRVIAGKPQAQQMFYVLVSKLGGLLNRQVYRLPVSRSTSLSTYTVQTIMETCQQCIRTGGILLAQPEHILSLQLMTIQKAIDGEKALAESLWKTHAFLEEKTRDIVDESDENFSTKFELIYTMGTQRIIEHSPRRWTMIQEVLGIVLRYARETKKAYPKGIEIGLAVHSSFPIIRFLDQKASDDILRQAAENICETGLCGFPLSHETPGMRRNLLRYISICETDRESQEAVEQSPFWSMHSSSVLLLRGLFARGVLDFVFGQKRWRVNYGLDPTRVPITQLAVPFRAKDSPSARSEFSHPDVVICLTCLSYYYGGMRNDDLQLSLEHLIKSDQADAEFEEWVRTSKGLPTSFTSLRGINLQDKEKCRESVFPHLRYSKGVVDYFLSHIVFNKEMKEFPLKLSASGWDIGRPKAHSLTGFSGTNDSQHFLPVFVTQLELDGQRHTNALVLGHLMRPENSVVSLADHGLRGICKSQDLLALILAMDPAIRVVLDVGAQVLDMTNEEFAYTWLLAASKVHEDIYGAVFCSTDDELCVIDRQGHVELLTTSRFSSQLDACIVFLDEAHTRGIDLQLPDSYRAAVTLGSNLTKDRLVQGTYHLDTPHSACHN